MTLQNAAPPVFQGPVLDLLRVNREIEQTHDGLSPGGGIRARRAELDRFLLVRYGLNCLALRFTGHSHPAPPPNGITRFWYGSTYEWYLQEDGSADFGRSNVRKGAGEVFEGRNPGDPGKTTIAIGPFRLEWSLSDWVYYPEHHEQTIAMAQTGAQSIGDVDAHSPQLEWWEMRSSIAWGEAVYGLQLGIDYQKAPHIYSAGDTLSFLLMLRNSSRRDVKLRRLDPLALQAEWKLINSAGVAAQWQHPIVDVRPSLVEQRLAPGQVVALGSYTFALAGGQPPRPDLSPVAAPPGLHKLICEFKFHPWSGLWPAVLTSGALDFEVLEKRSS